MTLAQLAIPSRLLATEVLQQDTPESDDASIVRLPRIMQELSDIERHILARATSHCWNLDGSIPYIPPTLHQRAVALALSAPSMRLLALDTSRPGIFAFHLTRLGKAVACRVLHLVPAAEDHIREREYDRMRALMRSDFGTLDQEEEEN